MNLEEFIKRYNQESDWNKEIIDPEFFNTHPFAKEKLIGYIDSDKITPENYDYSTAEIYEGTNKGGCYFECQMYCNEIYCTRYLWIHPFLDEKAYKEERLGTLKHIITELDDKLSSEIIKLSERKTELHEALDKLAEHLDSVSETLTDVEKAAIEYSAANPSEYKNGMYDRFDLNYAFEAGAAWQKQQLLNSAWDEASLKQWYIANVDANPPVWTDEHIEELCKDFILVKKNENNDEEITTVHGSITNAGGEFGYDVAAFRFDDSHSYTILLPHDENAKHGDKVKLVILKEK